MGKFNGQVIKGVIFDLDGTLIKSPKPSAKPLIMASELLGIDKENLIAVGDYKYDLMASRKAGIRNILVMHERHSREYQSLADWTVSSLIEIIRIYEILNFW